MSMFRRTARTVALGLVAGALAVTTAQPANAATFSEGFESGATPTGWQVVNLSSPLGVETWSQGQVDAFPAQAGTPSSYFAANYESGASEATINDWLITPLQASLSSTDVFEFWTRTLEGTTYPDRLEVRMSTNGSCNPGTTADGVGDFTTVLGTINPTLTDEGYPQAWTQYSMPLTGLGTTNVSGCVAFRYYVTNGGPSGENSNYIGIDSVAFTDNASVACTTAQASAASAQATVTTATATYATATTTLAKAKKVLKKARKALKKAKKAGDDTRIAKAKKKVKKATKAVRKATKKKAAARTSLTTAQTALTAAQTSTTTSCP